MVGRARTRDDRRGQAGRRGFSKLEGALATVRLIRNESNLGFGAANNRGGASARGDYLFFLYPDTYLLNDAIGEFLLSWNRPRDGGRGGGICFEDAEGNANHSYGSFENLRISAF